MIKALTTAATGVQAQQASIDNIANDLANAQTDGYKRGRVDFADLMYETLKEPGAALGEGSQTPVGVQRGLGVKVGAAHKIFEQGPARMTYNPFDVMIEGEGFFPVLKPNGEVAYTRFGAFSPDAQGRLVLKNGSQMIPQITLPANAVGTQISPSGEVIANLPGDEQVVLGQIQLVRFLNEQGLLAEGSGLYRVTPASGAPVQGLPGENGYGTLQQGALEGSNVNVANSMVDMITTQRAYEMGTKVMKVADEMMGSIVNVK